MEKPTITIEELLPILRKHGVIEYNSDQFGVRIKFEPSQPQQRLSVIEPAALEQARAEPPAPEMGHVEVIRHDIEDVLFGAK